MSTIFVFALESEAPNIFKNYSNVFEIGVGKVNAAINTVRLIKNHQPTKIVNLGTAGGITVSAGIHRVNKLVEHDVNLTPLGLMPGKQLNDKFHTISLLGEGVTCGSGDIFVTEPNKLRIECNIIDMEAFSIAKAAQICGVEVEIWKYITDSADSNASENWHNNVNTGETYYEKIIKQYLSI